MSTLKELTRYNHKMEEQYLFTLLYSTFVAESNKWFDSALYLFDRIAGEYNI
jgi:hypothetical protein